MEILSDILRSLRVGGSVYFCDQIDTPWHKEFINTTSAGFHLIRKGRCWARIGDTIEQLESGDLIFLGPGIDHTLTSEPPETQNTNASSATDNTLLLCGHCEFEQNTLTPLKHIFPTTTIVRKAEFDKHPWLKSTFAQLSSEYMAQKPGTEIIVNKLTEVVLVELVRINFGRQEGTPFLLALQDRRLSKALQLMHASPAQHWTIESLASQVGMSRAAFAKHFKDLVGETMFTYLSQLRIQKSKELLTRSKLAVEDIALEVGYESERAFTKTFGKYVGQTPKQYRKTSLL